MALTYHNNNSISNVTSFAQVPSGSPVLLSTATASSSASISFTSGIDSTYQVYKFDFISMHPANDIARLHFQVSTNGGSSYGVAMTTTAFVAYHAESDASAGIDYAGADDLAQSTGYQPITLAVGNQADEVGSGVLYLFAPSSSTYVKHFLNSSPYYNKDDSAECLFSAGYINSTSPINAINFKFNNGNIDAGTIKMYGLK